MSPCEHPAASQRSGVVPPLTGDAWRGISDHVWVACAACGEVLRSAPYADELEAEARAQRDRADEGTNA